MTRRAHIRAALTLTLAAAVLAAPSGAAGAAAPVVAASVATKDGTLIGPVAVRAKATRVKVGRKRCAVAAGTPLAALVALKAKAKDPKVGRIVLKDYGACGKRPSGSARLYLTGIGADRASGPDGWIYSVNGKGGSTSAADPAGPFGRGRIKQGAEVRWRWCRASEDPEGDCGDALEIAALAGGDLLMPPENLRQLTVAVQLRTGADGDAAGTLGPAPAATTVRALTRTGAELGRALTGADGRAVLALPANIPSGTRIVASGSAGVAPAGVLWRPEALSP